MKKTLTKFGTISFKPDKVILKAIVDTVESTGDNYLYLYDIFSLIDENNEDPLYGSAPNSTRDTIERKWIKAVALKDDLNTLKVISL